MLPALFYGTLTGILTGAVIWGYSVLAEKILELSASMYTFFTENLAFLPILTVVLLAAATLSYFNTKLTPEAKGGGVPYIEGAARGMLPLKWYKVAPAAIAGSFLSFLCGLPLGSEGPSVLIGGAVGSGVNMIDGNRDIKGNAWQRLSITGGASAGFATALNAPLAGILFALEECHKKFSPVVMLMAFISVLFSVVTSKLLRLWTKMGEHKLFEFQIVGLGVTDLYLPLIVGVVIGFAAIGFLWLLTKSMKAMGKLKVHGLIKIMAAFLLAGIACVAFIMITGSADLIGGGSGIINKVGNMSLGWKLILAYLIVKVFLIIFCASSRVSGGLFIPFLCIGALLGGLIAKVMVACGMDTAYFSTIVVIAMCAFLGSMLKAPITAIVLIIELAGGSVDSLFGSLIAIIVAYLITELFHTKPVYDLMLEDIIKNRREGKEIKTIQLEITVKEGSYAVGKVLRDILFPQTVTTVVHKNASDGSTNPKLYRRGERIIMVGDTIFVEAHTVDEKSLRDQLDDIFERRYNFKK